jgi:hypothetical protein
MEEHSTYGREKMTITKETRSHNGGMHPAISHMILMIKKTTRPQLENLPPIHHTPKNHR